jgi:hypothetical protein
MRHRSSYAQRIRRGARFRLLLLAGLLAAVFYFIQWRFMPILYSVTGYQAKVMPHTRDERFNFKGAF